MEGKSPFASKTLWFNVLALVIMLAMGYGYGEFEPAGEVKPLAEGILALITILMPLVNIGLRFVTKTSIKLK